MRRISQERRARRPRSQDAAHVFDPEVLRNRVLVGDVAHQALGALNVEIVDHKMPRYGGWIARHRAPYMRDKVGLGPRRSVRGAHHTSAGHVEVDHEQQRAVALVLELMSSHLAGAWRQVRCQSLQSLNVAQLVSADRALTAWSRADLAAPRGTFI